VAWSIYISSSNSTDINRHGELFQKHTNHLQGSFEIDTYKETSDSFQSH
jgi:hypothetical protein